MYCYQYFNLFIISKCNKYKIKTTNKSYLYFR